MFSLRDYPLWFYKIFTSKNLQTIYPSNSYNLFREVAFSFRAGYFLFSSRLYSLSNIPNPSRKDSRTSKAHNLPTSKVHNLPTSKLTTIQQAKLTTFQQAKAHSLQQTKLTTFLQAKSTAILQAKSTAILQAKAHNHTTFLMLKNTQKTSKSCKISPIFYPLTYF